MAQRARLPLFPTHPPGTHRNAECQIMQECTCRQTLNPVMGQKHMHMNKRKLHMITFKSNREAHMLDHVKLTACKCMQLHATACACACTYMCSTGAQVQDNTKPNCKQMQSSSSLLPSTPCKTRWLGTPFRWLSHRGGTHCTSPRQVALRSPYPSTTPEST